MESPIKLIAKVYVVQDDGRKNLVPAMKFGDLVVLSGRDMPVFADTGPTVNSLKTKLKDFDPENDWLLMTGDPILIGTITAIIAKRYNKVRCLKWDKQNLDYLPIIVLL
jgi:hypothetical protein